MIRLFKVVFLSIALFSASGCALVDSLQPPADGDSDLIGDGEAGDGEAGDGEAGDGEAGDGEAGDGEAGNGEAGDGEAGDGETGDGETGDGEDPECALGEVRPCDCFFDSSAETFPGEEICDDGEVWGECLCPDTCSTDTGEEVYQGAPCSLCGSSTIICDGDLAQCLDPVDVNACGSCPADGNLSLSDCTDSESLFCDEALEPFCASPDLASTQVELPGLELESEDRVFYLFIAGIDPEVGCTEGWEFPVAAVPSSGYQEAGVEDLNSFSVILPAANASFSSGVLRVLVQKHLPLYDEVDGSADVLVTTHFGCQALPLGTGVLEVEPYIHPYLFQGEYELSLRYNTFDEMPSGMESQFLYQTLSPWAQKALIGGPLRPQALLFGCPDAICGDSNGFASLFEQFHQEQSRPEIPTPNFWDAFYSRYSTFVGDGDNRDLVLQVYEDLYQEWIAPYGNVSEPISGTRYLFWRDRVTSNRRVLLNLTDMDGVFRLQGDYAGAQIIADGIEIGRQGASGSPPFQRFFVTGNQPTPYPNPRPIQGYVSTERPFKASFSPDLTSLTINADSHRFRGDALARYLVFDYLPRYLIPDLLVVDDGTDLIRTFQTFATNLDMHRALFPCDEVLSRLETAEMDQQNLDRFEELCEEIYGDPDGPELLLNIQNRMPLERQDWVYRLLMSFDLTCPVQWEADPLVGFRFRKVGTETASNCGSGELILVEGPLMGIPGSLLVPGFFLKLSRELTPTPTEF